MTERQFSDEELITGSVEDDLERASIEGTVADVNRVLEKYETKEVAEIDSQKYYRIPLYERGDPEVAIVSSDGSVEVKEFADFISTVGTGVIHRLSYDQLIDRDIQSEIEEDIYRQNDVVYHVTTIENSIDILQKGVLEARNETRGRTNRSTGSAVFASELDPDFAHGEVVFEIDIDKMVSDGFTPNAGREVPVEEARIEETIAQKFEMYEYRAELEASISRQTVVIYEDIPVDYLSIDSTDSVKQEIREEVSEDVCESVNL